MIQLMSVNFDDHIPNWRTQLETIRYNVLVVVREGKVRYEINGEEIIAEEEDVLFIPQSTRRSGGNWNDILHRKYTILFTMDPQVTTGIPFLDGANSSNSILRIFSMPTAAAIDCSRRCAAAKATAP